MKTLARWLVSFCFLALAAASPAVTIWDNGTPDGVDAAGSDFDIPFQFGDNFSVAASATANQIQWWGAYFHGHTPSTTDDFTIRFFTITSGVPAILPFASYNVGDVGRVDSGVDISVSSGVSDVYVYSTIIPATFLAPGDYLLSIVNNTPTDTDDDWFWATSSATGQTWGRFNDGEAWLTGDLELAFNISGSVGNGVPEGGSALLLMLMSVVGLLGLQRVVRGN